MGQLLCIRTNIYIHTDRGILGYVYISTCGLRSLILMFDTRQNTSTINPTTSISNRQYTKMSIQPFTINVPDSQLQTLREKLTLTTFPDELDNAEWDMGAPLDEVSRLATVWKNDFNWREKEKQLNERLAQFTVPVPVEGFGELEVHFLHHRSESPNAVPLLFVHGCMYIYFLSLSFWCNVQS